MWSRPANYVVTMISAVMSHVAHFGTPLSHPFLLCSLIAKLCCCVKSFVLLSHSTAYILSRVPRDAMVVMVVVVIFRTLKHFCAASSLFLKVLVEAMRVFKGVITMLMTDQQDLCIIKRRNSSKNSLNNLCGFENSRGVRANPFWILACPALVWRWLTFHLTPPLASPPHRDPHRASVW